MTKIHTKPIRFEPASDKHFGASISAPVAECQSEVQRELDALNSLIAVLREHSTQLMEMLYKGGVLKDIPSAPCEPRGMTVVESPLGAAIRNLGPMLEEIISDINYTKNRLAV